MAITAAGIIFSSLNDNTLSRLTSERTVAAIPFACRYRLVDFALSAMVNANISNINIVANYNYRSLTEHIGTGKDWDLARREGGINIISPYQTARSSSAKIFSSHLEALMSMKEYIEEFKEEYVILMDSDNVLNIDLNDVLKAHVRTGAKITMVTHSIDKTYTSKRPRIMISSVAGKVSDMTLSDVYTERNPELAINIFVMSTVHLRKLIEEAEGHGLTSLTNMMLKNFKNNNYRTYNFTGFVASVSSFLDYYKYSIELAKNDEARTGLLFKRESPVFTRVHNSAPVVYKASSKFENSMIADDCIIEGTVINSVLFRGVHVKKGAVVKNCVLFAKTYVGENANLNCIVTDKEVHISDNVNLSGNENMPFYVQKGRRV